jgi:hypothetical protein
MTVKRFLLIVRDFAVQRAWGVEERGVLGRGLRCGAGLVAAVASLVGAGTVLAASGRTASEAAPCTQTGLQNALNRGGTYEFRARARSS